MINFEIILLEGCAVRKRIQWKCNNDMAWADVEAKFNIMAKPFKILTARYRDSDGDMITISNSDDFREAIKYATNSAASHHVLHVFLDVEKSLESEVAPETPPRMSASTSEVSVGTPSFSTASEPYDVASLKKEIVDSVLAELRKDSGKKSTKKAKSPKSPNQSKLTCGACSKALQTNQVYFKCANCKFFILCEDCEQKNEFHIENGHVFIKLRGLVKPEFAKKVLLKQLILQQRNGKSVKKASTSSTSTSADLIGFEDITESDTTPQNSIAIISDGDLMSASVVKPSEPAEQQTRERSHSESTYASVSENEHETSNTVSQLESAEEEDDFLVVPLPPCFDLDKPMLAVPSPVRSVVEKKDSGSQCEARKVDSKETQATESKKQSLEAAVQHDLDCLAQSMAAPVQANSACPVPAPPQSPQPQQSRFLSFREPAPPTPCIPPPPSFILQAASVSDSTPASISLSPRPPMDQLIEMGFGDRRLNGHLLDKYHGNVELVISHLLDGNRVNTYGNAYGFDWC